MPWPGAWQVVHFELCHGDEPRGALHLVDLAGSERIKDSQVSGKALEEAKFINKSLTSLGDVISGELTPRRTPHARRLARARRLTRHQPTCLTRRQPTL